MKKILIALLMSVSSMAYADNVALRLGHHLNDDALSGGFDMTIHRQPHSLVSRLTVTDQSAAEFLAITRDIPIMAFPITPFLMIGGVLQHTKNLGAQPFLGAGFQYDTLNISANLQPYEFIGNEPIWTSDLTAEYLYPLAPYYGLKWRYEWIDKWQTGDQIHDLSGGVYWQF